MFKDHSRSWLTRQYVAAVLLTGVIAIGSRWFAQRATQEMAGYAKVINMAGRQRMLSQRIPSLAMQYRMGDTSARIALEAAIETMARDHDELAAMGRDVPVLRDVFAPIPYVDSEGATLLDAEVGRYLRAAHGLAARTPTDGAGSGAVAY